MNKCWFSHFCCVHVQFMLWKSWVVFSLLLSASLVGVLEELDCGFGCHLGLLCKGWWTKETATVAAVMDVGRGCKKKTKNSRAKNAIR